MPRNCRNCARNMYRNQKILQSDRCTRSDDKEKAQSKVSDTELNDLIKSSNVPGASAADVSRTRSQAGSGLGPESNPRTTRHGIVTRNINSLHKVLHASDKTNKSPVMADVANSITASSPVNANSGRSSLGDPPEGGMISPGVKEALDRIIPMSASQLFQMPEPNNFDSSIKEKENGVDTDPEGKSLVLSTNYDSSQPTANGDSGKNDTGQKDRHEKQGISKLRISRANLDVMSSLPSEASEAGHKKMGRNDALPGDASSSDYLSHGGSDSEDMCRPFVTLARERKERKKHKKKKKEGEIGRLRLVLSNVKDSDDDHSSREFQISHSKRKTRNEINLNESNLSKRSIISAIEKEYCNEKKQKSRKRDGSRKSSVSSQGEPDLSKTSDSKAEVCVNGEVSVNGTVPATTTGQPVEASMELIPQKETNCENDIDTTWPLSEAPCKDLGLITEDTSNISFSSSKENVQSRFCSGQKLPRIRRSFYHLKDSKKAIRNTFPRCYIVLKKLSDVSSIPNNVLPLSERVQFLKNKCLRGEIKCRKHKKKKRHKEVEEYEYKNIFEETAFGGNSEEEFQNSRGGRSLRKRNQNISYREPSEFADDISEGKRKKKSRSKKEGEDEWLLDSSDESKKDKSISESESISKSKEPVKGADGVNITTSIVVEDNVTKVIAYPKKRSKEKQDKSKDKQSKSKDKADKSKKSSQPVTTSTIVTTPPVEPATTSVVNALPIIRPIPPVMSNVPLGLSGAVSRLPGPIVPSSSITPAALRSKGPQYCVMKMGGKDVLVQLVPSSGPSMQSVIVPSSQGSRIPLVPGIAFPPPRIVSPTDITMGPRLIGQSTVQTSLSTATTTTLTGPGGAIFRIAGPVVSSAVPILPMSQFTGFTGTTGLRPLSSGSVLRTPVALTSAAGVLASTVPTSIVISQATTSGLTTTSAVPTSSIVGALSSIVTSGTATSTSAQRHVRVFVPGCSATGTRGHFTTLSSYQSTSNPLTRLTASSQLLPQRKRPQDQLSPEQRAAKRRKLEKKYPLPPGVVIKTEPLDTPPVATNTTAVRSLLRQGCIQVISNSRGAAGQLQSIRIITPSLAASLNTRPTRPVGNMVYRAAGLRGGQTVLVPMSLGAMNTTTGSVPSAVTTSRPRNQVVTCGNVVLVSPPPSVSLLSSCKKTTTTTTTTNSTTTTPSSSAGGRLSSTTAITTSSTSSSSTEKDQQNKNTDKDKQNSTDKEQLNKNAADNSIVVIEEDNDESQAVGPAASDPPRTLRSGERSSSSNDETSLATSEPSTASDKDKKNPTIESADKSASNSAEMSNADKNVDLNAEKLDTSSDVMTSAPNGNAENACEAAEKTQESSAPTAEVGQSETSDHPLSTSAPVTSSTSTITTLPSTISTTTVTTSSIQQAPPVLTIPRPAESQSPAVSLDILQDNINKLKTLIEAQEARGLKGDRLDKLRSVLKEKEEALIALQQQQEEEPPPSDSEMPDITGQTFGQENTGEELGGTEEDPFVID